MLKRTIARLLVAACVLAAALTISSPASAYWQGSYLRRDGSPGQAITTLLVDDYIQRTSNGYYYWLILQGDGNLVLYKGNVNHQVNKVCWASNKFGTPGRAVYQGDGNLVVYSLLVNAPIWGSNTVGDTGTTVDISASGRLYVGYTVLSSAC